MPHFGILAETVVIMEELSIAVEGDVISNWSCRHLISLQKPLRCLNLTRIMDYLNVFFYYYKRQLQNVGRHVTTLLVIFKDFHLENTANT